MRTQNPADVEVNALLLAGRGCREDVRGRMVLYLCSLVAEDACADSDLAELAGCVGVIAQLADDVRHGELVLGGACDREELTRAAMRNMLAPALGSIALVARLGPCIPSRGTRVALAHMTITTTAMLNRVRCSVDGAIHHVLDASPHPSVEASHARRSGEVGLLAIGDPRSMPSSMGPLIVSATFALVETLPVGVLTAELPELQVRRMMIGDHLAFSALERLRPNDADGMRALATQFQIAAADRQLSVAPGRVCRPAHLAD